MSIKRTNKQTKSRLRIILINDSPLQHVYRAQLLQNTSGNHKNVLTDRSSDITDTDVTSILAAGLQIIQEEPQIHWKSECFLLISSLFVLFNSSNKEGICRQILQCKQHLVEEVDSHSCKYPNKQTHQSVIMQVVLANFTSIN